MSLSFVLLITILPRSKYAPVHSYYGGDLDGAHRDLFALPLLSGRGSPTEIRAGDLQTRIFFIGLAIYVI